MGEHVGHVAETNTQRQVSSCNIKIFKAILNPRLICAPDFLMVVWTQPSYATASLNFYNLFDGLLSGVLCGHAPALPCSPGPRVIPTPTARHPLNAHEWMDRVGRF